MSNEAVLTSTHNLCFRAKIRKTNHNFSSENYHFYSREKLQYISWARFHNEMAIASNETQIRFDTTQSKTKAYVFFKRTVDSHQRLRIYRLVWRFPKRTGHMFLLPWCSNIIELCVIMVTTSRYSNQCYIISIFLFSIVQMYTRTDFLIVVSIIPLGKKNGRIRQSQCTGFKITAIITYVNMFFFCFLTKH